VISYALLCDKGHGFDSWLRDSEAFEAQRARGLLACPSCGSTAIEKAIMAPRVARKDRSGAASRADAPADAPRPVALVSPQEAALRAKLKDLRAELTKNSDYVGPNFAEEARKIHYGETGHRSIHGEATPDDARALYEDGIEFHPLPGLPEERN